MLFLDENILTLHSTRSEAASLCKSDANRLVFLLSTVVLRSCERKETRLARDGNEIDERK